MKFYQLKTDKPKWFFDPATNRQLKVLRFFGVDTPPSINKGVASGKITTLFQSKENKDLWEKYVYHTGDDFGESADLADFNIDELRAVVVPEDWRAQDRVSDTISAMLREGSPFDDPVPPVQFEGSKFVFTGKFTSGQRTECQDAVKSLGGVAQSSVSGSTDYLIIGGEGSAHWSQGSHGAKIEKAMILRMESGKPFIISESDWLAAIQSHGE